RGPLLPRLCQLAVASLELVQRLRQALLKVADSSAVVLGRLAPNRGLGLALVLRRLWAPAPRPPLASQSDGGSGRLEAPSRALFWVRSLAVLPPTLTAPASPRTQGRTSPGAGSPAGIGDISGPLPPPGGG